MCNENTFKAPSSNARKDSIPYVKQNKIAKYHLSNGALKLSIFLFYRSDLCNM